MKSFRPGLIAVLMIGLGAGAGAQGTAPPAQSQTPAAQSPAVPAPMPGQGKFVQRVLVKVNGEIFTQKDLQEALIEALQKRNKDVRNLSELDSPALSPLLVELTPQVLAEAIDDRILIQRARELGFKMTDAQYKDAVENLKKENKMDDATFKKALESQGMTMEQLRDKLENITLRHMLEQQEIMSRVATTDEEARQYYEKHPDEFVAPATITLREIVAVVSAGPASSALSFSGGSGDAGARAKIDAAVERIKKGEDFAKVAAEVSDAPSKGAGGLMGPIVVDDLNDTLKTATGALKAGQVSDVIKTSRGYQILKVEARGNKGVEPFDKVRQKIFQKIYDQRLDGETKKYVDRLRGAAIIEWKDENLKKLYDSLNSK